MAALIFWHAAPRMCLQLGDRWVKGLGSGGSTGQMFRCSSGETTHRRLRIHTQTRGETVWVWRGSEGWRWKCLITFLSAPAERVSPSSKASLHSLSMFPSLRPFTHFPCLFLPLVLRGTHPSSSFTHSQRLCPQNYPVSSLKRSAWNHQITMEEEKKNPRGEKGALFLFLFLFLSHDTFLVAQMCTYNLHFSLWEDRDGPIFCSPCCLSAPSSSACSLPLSISLFLSLLGWVLMGLYGSPMLLRHLVLASL